MDEKATTKLSDAERQPCEVWCRVMGYFRPTSFYNRGKKSEFEERVNFTEAAVAKHNQKEARQ